MELADHNSGIHRVHAYTLRRKLEGRAASELVKPGLAYAISQHTWKRARAGYTRYVHDVSFRAFKMRRRELHQMEDRAQIDVHHLVPKLESCVLNASRFQNPRSVDEHVEPAESLHSL